MYSKPRRICGIRLFLLVACGLFGLTTQAAADNPVFKLELEWWDYADPGGMAHGSAPVNPLTGDRGGYGLDRGEVGGESAVFSSDGQLIVTASRSNARTTGDTPAYVHDLNGNTAHLRLWKANGTLLWDQPRNAPGSGDHPMEDEIEHAAFTTHVTNRDRYVVAGGEDDKIEVWEVRDAAGDVLASPKLVRTLDIPGGRDAAFDSVGFSNSGELLIGGTEYHGHVEFWRATGDPSTWTHVGDASHGGANIGKAVNEFDLSSDDRYMITAGTNQEGGFWELSVNRDVSSGEITSVSATRLATMKGPMRSAKAARFESGTDRIAVIASKDQRMLVYDVERLKTGDTTPMTVLHNGLYHGVDRMTGVEIEPGGWSRDGRFLIQGGGPEENFHLHPNSADYESSFFRVYEAAEIQDGAPEPDPIWVQPAFHTEFFHFSADDSRLATSHDDGTVRVWDVTTGGAETIVAEAFNELTGTHGRWTLSGSLSTTAGDNEWGVTHDQPANPLRTYAVPVTQDVNWVGHRGARYLGADNLEGKTHALTLAQAWNLDGFTQRKLQFAAAGAVEQFESGDFLRLLVDTDGDDEFETTLAEFLPDNDGNLALGGDGQKLDYMFRDFYFDLEPLLADDTDGRLRFRIEANTNSGSEELAFDSLRVTGVPEPATAGFLGIGGALLLSRRRSGK